MFCYQNWNLLFAALTSPWEPKANIKKDWTFETWPWQFSPLDFTIWWVRKDNHIYIDKVAWTTGPMPKATRVTWKMPDGTDIDWIYLHAGPTNWSIASRGCFRLHAFIANLVERKVADGTPGQFRPDIKIS